MASVSIYILVGFHALFFWTLYTKPFTLATSELISTFFPTWLKGSKYDAFWLNTSAHPVLSKYYPINILSSIYVQGRNRDYAFKVFIFSILGHFLFAVCGWYILLSQWFNPIVGIIGSITFTYQAYHLKQQPCVIYTLAWFPWIAIAPWLGVSMTLLAGYYPLAIYLLPMGFFLNPSPIQWIIGIILGSIQLVPFIRYLPKTIRSNGLAKVEAGPFEKKYYFGILPWLLIGPKHLIVVVIIAAIYLLRNYLPRVPWRAGIIATYTFIWFSIENLANLHLSQGVLYGLLFIQCADLWLHNRLLLPTRPYCELQNKPSLAFNTKLTRYLDKHLGDYRVSGLPFPLFTGLINNFKTLGYSGGMQLKLMAKFRRDTNLNGSGHHDWFMNNEDTTRLDDYRVLFAYSNKKLDWAATPVHNLYRNPRL